MKANYCIVLSILPFFVFSQNKPKNNSLFFIPEISLGITGEANTDFPNRKLQKQGYIHFAKDTKSNDALWVKILKAPTIGISLGITDFGNPKELGYAVSVLPFIEFPLFKSKHFKVHFGTGISYINPTYSSDNNPNNKAISTPINWAFRAFSYYQFSDSKKINWRLGLGYAHHSNGHIKLPNQGFNSFAFSTSAQIKRRRRTTTTLKANKKYNTTVTKYSFISLRSGFGLNTLSPAFNTKKKVFTFSAEYGKVYNSIYKIGIGAYYRFYEGYYYYIKNNESLVQDGREFEAFKTRPIWYASNLGVNLHGELLLSHIGIDVQLGFNLFKPAYKIDWRINKGWEYVPQEIPEHSNIVLGELDSYFKIKQLISTRLGLTYYFKNTEKAPKNNFFIGAFINANLGQADFTEVAIGYLHRL